MFMAFWIACCSGTSGFASIRQVRLERVSASVAQFWCELDNNAQFHDESGALFRRDVGSPIHGHKCLMLGGKVLDELGLQAHCRCGLLPLWLSHANRAGSHHILEAGSVHLGSPKGVAGSEWVKRRE